MANRISHRLIDSLGGDWGLYGEVTGPGLLNLLSQDKLRIVFASDAILVDIQRPDGLSGTYILRHTQEPVSIEVEPVAFDREYLLEVAARRKGLPYELPPDPSGLQNIDCSLYVLLTYKDAGYPLPSGVRTAEQIRQATRLISLDAVLPGDLLFFENTYDAQEAPGPDGRLATHIGISLGRGTQRMWNANERQGVDITDISTEYWQERLFEARRFPTGGVDVSSTHPIDLSAIAIAAEIPDQYKQNVFTHWPMIYRILTEYRMNTTLNCIGVIGTIAHETASRFAPIHEFYNEANWNSYDGGPNYHGRGFIQLTHKYNYSTYGDILGIDLVSNPDMALEPDIAARILCEYWQVRGIEEDCERKDWAEVRKKVYGAVDQAGLKRIQQVYNTLVG